MRSAAVLPGRTFPQCLVVGGHIGVWEKQLQLQNQTSNIVDKLNKSIQKYDSLIKLNKRDTQPSAPRGKPLFLGWSESSRPWRSRNLPSETLSFPTLERILASCSNCPWWHTNSSVSSFKGRRNDVAFKSDLAWILPRMRRFRASPLHLFTKPFPWRIPVSEVLISTMTIFYISGPRISPELSLLQPLKVKNRSIHSNKHPPRWRLKVNWFAHAHWWARYSIRIGRFGSESGLYSRGDTTWWWESAIFFIFCFWADLFASKRGSPTSLHVAV